MDGDAETLDLQAGDPAAAKAPDLRRHDLATVLEGHEDKLSMKAGGSRSSSALMGVKRLGKCCCTVLKWR